MGSAFWTTPRSRSSHVSIAAPAEPTSSSSVRKVRARSKLPFAKGKPGNEHSSRLRIQSSTALGGTRRGHSLRRPVRQRESGQRPQREESDSVREQRSQGSRYQRRAVRRGGSYG